MSKFWSNNRIQQLVQLKHEPEWNQKFLEAAGKAQQTKKCWDDLSKIISPTLTGVEAKEKYNYLLKMYRQYDAEAKTSGNGQVSWRHYYFLKEYFISDPSITPVALIDTENYSLIENRDSDDETLNESNVSLLTAPKVTKTKKQSKNEMGKEFLTLYEKNTEAKNEYYQCMKQYYAMKTNLLNSEDQENKKRLEKVENSNNEIKDILMQLMNKINNLDKK